MAGRVFSLSFGLGAFLLGLTAVYLGLSQDRLLHLKDEYGVILPFSHESPPVVIDLAKDIKYVGSREHEVEHFQNIFYGEDTSGVRRFAPPIAVQPLKGSTIDATRPGAWCPQGLGDVFPFTSRVANISENCLSLRVARPGDTKPDAKLPVMVWIHGGGHALGSASEILYKPDGLVKQAVADGQPLIFVAINYRLGFFGFAISKALIDAKQTNAGLHDQRRALEWVRDNIEAFGGDPDKVTAVGQSVGAADISLHLASYEGKRGVPFQQAIMMSGSPGLNFNTKSDLVANNTAAVAREVGCVENDSQSVETLNCLRKVSIETLANISVSTARAARPPFGEAFFYPMYDGDILTDRPSRLVRAGKFTRGIPIIASWVSNDGAWYAAPTISTDQEVLDTFGLWLYALSEPTKARLLELYPIEDFEGMVRLDYDGSISPQYYRAAQLNRDLWFTCPILEFAWQYVRNGGVEKSHMHLYEHNSTRYAPSFEMMGVQMWRVAHLSDIPYVLNAQHLERADNSEKQLQLSKAISTKIVKFVTSGVPEDRWPAAFANATMGDLKGEFPNKLSLQLLGGPHHNMPITIDKSGDEDTGTAAEQAVRWEKLFGRCEFINSDKVRAEIGT
ncbi:lipase [Hypoxylon trugodes]|uniref:lipase n=1 Tax=Hypoxylon trugodes TaxID=326681 RepID=UPI0021960D3C|nr:lipase [Hypoxylon trugodes]KAI1384570.1 lipase [Hypoxylon trugodes]